MIKFFRHIRKSLLEQNKMGKYFKYAFGEIILVVIGILIALQVNEWNNERNRKKNEQVVIDQLITELSQSQYELEAQQFANLGAARMYSLVLRAFWKDKLPADIGKYVRGGGGSTVYSPILGTANSLITSGKLDVISSKSLKNEIVAYVETVDYTLKDINRYEESYFRPGVSQLIEALPTTTRSKEEMNERIKASLSRDKSNFSYDMNLHEYPTIVDKVPFNVKVDELFKDKSFYIANKKLQVYHRNISWKYSTILDLNNKLLAKLYLASKQHQKLGVKLTDKNYYLIFDNEDLKILKQADAILNDDSKWSKRISVNCPGDKETYSLICALKKASLDVDGKWEENPNRPAIRLLFHKLLEDKNRRYILDMLEEWNNHPDTTFKDVKDLLSECIALVENQISKK